MLAIPLWGEEGVAFGREEVDESDPPPEQGNAKQNGQKRKHDIGEPLEEEEGAFRLLHGLDYGRFLLKKPCAVQNRGHVDQNHGKIGA